MKIIAKDIMGREAVLVVRSNPFAILGWGSAVYVTDGATGEKSRYAELTHFFNDWEVIGSRQHQVRLPWLKSQVGLGTVAGSVLAFFHILPSDNCGCPDRKTWWNWLLAFVPWDGGYKDGV